MNEKKDITTDAIKSAGKITLIRAAKYVPGLANTIDGFREFKGLIAETQSKLHELKLKEYLLGISECPDDIVITDEDFSHVIRQLVKDDEISKTGFYYKLTISLSNSTMDRDERAFYINTLGSLTRYEIEFARQCLIYSSFDISGYKDRKDQMSELISGNDGILLKTVNKLISGGLIFDTKSAGDPVSVKASYNKTTQLEKFISYIYENIFINPEAIHEKEKDKFDILYVLHSDDDYTKKIYEEIISMYEKDSIKVGIVTTNGWWEYKSTARVFEYAYIDSDGRYMRYSQIHDIHLAMDRIKNGEKIFDSTLSGVGIDNENFMHYKQMIEETKRALSIEKNKNHK